MELVQSDTCVFPTSCDIRQKCPKLFLLTKIKPEYCKILYNPTHFPVPLVCRIRQVPLHLAEALVVLLVCFFLFFFVMLGVLRAAVVKITYKCLIIFLMSRHLCTKITYVLFIGLQLKSHLFCRPGDFPYSL